MEADATPLPRPEQTPPVTKMYLVILRESIHAPQGTVN